MIDWTVTVGNIITIIMITAGALSAFFYQRAQVDKKIDRKEFDEFRLMVTREYVSTGHLKDVEARMTSSMEVLANEVRGLRTDILALYKSRSTRS